MRKALLCFEIADEFAATAFGELCVGERDVGGSEVGGDVGGGGFFADDEDLGMAVAKDKARRPARRADL